MDIVEKTILESMGYTSPQQKYHSATQDEDGRTKSVSSKTPKESRPQDTEPAKLKKIEVFISSKGIREPEPVVFFTSLFREYGYETKSITGSEVFGTINRGLLLAVLYSLKSVDESSYFVIYSNLEYVVDTLRFRKITKWRNDGYTMVNGKGKIVDVANSDVLEGIYQQLKKHKITARYISKNDYKEELNLKSQKISEEEKQHYLKTFTTDNQPIKNSK